MNLMTHTLRRAQRWQRHPINHWWVLGASALVLLVAAAAITLVLVNQRDDQQLRLSQQADIEWADRMLRIQVNRQTAALQGLVADWHHGTGIPSHLKQSAQQLLQRYDAIESLALYNDRYEFVDLIAGKAVWLPAPDLPPSAREHAQHARQLELTIFGSPYIEPISAYDHRPSSRRTGFIDLYLPLPFNTNATKTQVQAKATEARRGSDLEGGFLIATLSLGSLLAETIPTSFAQRHEVTLRSSDGERLTTLAIGGLGGGSLVSDVAVELPGASFQLQADAIRDPYEALPNLLLSAVGLLAAMVLASLVMLELDIRDRRQLTHRLHGEVSMRRAMENSLLIGLRARDMEGKVTYVNRALCEMLGYEPDELIGSQPPNPYWAPEMVPQQQARRAQRLQGRWSTDGFETVFIRRTGERIHVLIYESPLVNEQGRQTGWMSSILDITAQREVEELSRIQQERLERSAQLTAMGELASTIAHELNQPLAAITSYATACGNLLQQAQQRMQVQDESLQQAQIAQQVLQEGRLEQALQRITQQAQRSGEVLRSLLDFVRRREPKPQIISIAALLTRVTPIIELLAHQSQIEWLLEVPENLPSVEVDPPLIEQVFVNLCRNGIQAMSEQSAPSDLSNPRERPRRLRLQATLLCVLPAKREMLEISIADEGVGIDEAAQARLFAPFYTTRADGVGLGLNLSRTIVERHGGQLWLETQASYRDGYATMFRLTLPTCAEQANETPSNA